MNLLPFQSMFPELKEETALLKAPEDSALPVGLYSFVEMYCADPECDCQLVYLNVIDQNHSHYASIAYGWKNHAFYNRYFYSNDHGFPGPSLGLMQPQSRYADYLLDFCQTYLLQDPSYTELLKRHYVLFKKAIGSDLNDLPQAKRNAPCSCGSGKKYKKCCY